MTLDLTACAAVRPRPAVVLTTVHVPYLLEAYFADTRPHDPLYVVVADRKTPDEGWCVETAKGAGVDLVYMDCDDQVEYLRKFPELVIPWDTDHRRSIGHLYAYESGCDPIVMLDDDNLLSQPDWLGKHVAGRDVEVAAFTSSTGWLNPCRGLEDRRRTPFFHRGYPLGQRDCDPDVRRDPMFATGRVAVNAGLWLGAPDVDAVQWLTRPLDVVAAVGPARFALAPGTWAPFNSQNTSIARDVLPAYFLCPSVGRNADIWASYVVVKIAQHLGDLVTYGSPLVRSERNPHDYWTDLDAERDCLRATDVFCQRLRSIDLVGKSYAECYAEIADGFDVPTGRWLAKDMRTWVKTMERAGG
jgi:hypothetical protein